MSRVVTYIWTGAVYLVNMHHLLAESGVQLGDIWASEREDWAHITCAVTKSCCFKTGFPAYLNQYSLICVIITFKNLVRILSNDARLDL